MNLKEQLKAKQNELLALKDKIEAGDQEAITKAGEIADAITELEASIAAAEKANAILKAMGTPEGEEVAEENSAKSGMKYLFKQAKNVDRSKRGWSISTSVKAATDVITSVQIPEIDREPVLKETSAPRLSDLLPQARLTNGNAVTYFTEDGFEGGPNSVAEGAKKPQGSDGFTPHTAPLVKIAGYVKETDEVLDDNQFLADVVDDVHRRKMIKAENVYVIDEIVNHASSSVVEYTADAQDANKTTQAMMEAILGAKAQIEENTDYVADVVLMNSADAYAMAIAKDANGQYFGGGWASGAYGNGSYNGAVTPWGLRIFTNSGITAGNPIVIATDATKFYRKNDVSVRVYDQNEDDAVYNRVTIVTEERVLAVVRNAEAVVPVQPKA